MDIDKIIAVLHSERQSIDQAIAVLRHVGGRRRRGRPPKWMSHVPKEKRSPADRKKKPVENAHRIRELAPSRSPN
jgi:hypothetical protein